MNKTLTRIITVPILSLLILTVFIGCSGDSDSNEYAVDISSNGELVASITLTQLHSLPEVTITASGKDGTGPTLISVLEFVNITDFTKLTVKGMSKGRIAEAELDLTKAEIDNTVILDFNNQGKTKLTGVNIAENRWIIDVEKIGVE